MQKFQVFLRWLPVVSLLCIALLLGHHAWERYAHYANLKQRLDTLQAEIGTITNENRSISKQIEWYRDPTHLEEKAKKELNLKREGEGVIIIVDEKDTVR